MRVRRASVGTLLGLVLLLAQVGVFIDQHTGSSRYFAWAPNDYVVDYNLRVRLSGHELSPDEIASRYRLSPDTVTRGFTVPDRGLTGHTEAPPRHLIDNLRTYERTYGRGEGAELVLVYRLNRHRARTWQWP